jgi:beta-lactamase class D
MDMKSAMKVSCVPYYQELARRVGDARMQEMVILLNYGNKDISGGIDEFWLTGSLSISQVEQIDFLRRLCGSELPVSLRSMEITKKIMLQEETPEFTLRGKTVGRLDEPSIGWFVGC